MKNFRKKIPNGLGDRASWMEGGIKIGVFPPQSRFLSKTVQDTAIVTMENE